MINLTNKAAKRFRVKWSNLEEQSGDFWKIDVQMIERVPMLFIVHEYTLFTLVRRKTQFRDPLLIAGEIKIACPWYRYVGEPTLGKNANRKITGSISEMKRMTWGSYSPEQINAIEMFLNDGLYSYLSTDKRNYGRPFEAVESYVKGKTPWL
jgi:hypothetical protein